ncbi:hypothetical protein N7517_005712 [Penicillium concentricum]|uniref:Uncharacterized protein n=1 Tax=Penicillium concentricum TaxID=293559 RepID=A0A9W9VBV2_9EURO|nr:uncharacterized protein N7517_005712 [Penicillium concentricum]KAJ5373706.1 hypothetical protein N7517_005712 [Penicillium concentricum]
MYIAFHWLSFVKDGPSQIPAKRTEGIPTKEHIFSNPYYNPRVDPGYDNVLFHTRMGKPILSGHVFTMMPDGSDGDSTVFC